MKEKYSDFKVTKITKGTLEHQIRPLIQSKLDELKKFGLVLELDKITYGDEHFTAKLNARLENGKPKMESDLEKYFTEDQYQVGDIVRVDADYVMIKGYNPQKRKYGLLIEKVFISDTDNGLHVTTPTVSHNQYLKTYEDGRDTWKVIARQNEKGHHHRVDESRTTYKLVTE